MKSMPSGSRRDAEMNARTKKYKCMEWLQPYIGHRSMTLNLKPKTTQQPEGTKATKARKDWQKQERAVWKPDSLKERLLFGFQRNSFLRDEKRVVGVCFVLAKKPTKGMAKKVEVQEKKKNQRCTDYFFVYIPLTF